MHEFSIAKPVVEKVLALAKEKKAKTVKSIEISIGELILLGEEEEFRFWLKEMLNEEEIAKNTRIQINTVKALIECRKCGYKGNLEVTEHHHHIHPIFLCPKCKDSDINIKEGRDCVINNINLEM